jgi:quercetin dioxygenase-like cupin family protein
VSSIAQNEIIVPVSQALIDDGDGLRSKIDKIEQEIAKLPQIEMVTNHHFAEGLYARELHIPAGTILTGKIHKTEHINIVSKGRIIVWTEAGMKEVSAPFTMVSYPGTKRVGYALEDTIWTTIHASNEKDLVKLEEQLIAKTYDEVQLTAQQILQIKEASK